MKKTLLSIVALALSVAASQAAKIDKASISKDAKFVVHLDLDAFRASKIGTTVLEKIREDKGGEKLDALAEIIGFDPLSAIHGATLSGNGEEDNGILVVKHKADNAKLLAFMKLDENYRKSEHGKHEIHGVGDRSDGERGYISFVNDTTAVLAPSRELVGMGIDLVNGKGRLWQKNKSRGPWDTITITEERKKRGFTSIGKVTINKQKDAKKFETATGFFIEKDNPK